MRVSLLRGLLTMLAVALACAVPASAPAVEPSSPAATPTGEAPGTSTAQGAVTITQPSEPATPNPAQAPPAPQVQAQLPQRNTGSPRSRPAPRRSQAGKRKAGTPKGKTRPAPTPAQAQGSKNAPSPATLTPSLPLSLQGGFAGVPSFFIESFRIPPFLLPIFQAAGTAYGIPWQVLAAINEVETDYGRDLSVSSAGAEGWMQFLPAEWAQYGVDANGDGFEDPYNPADAIFAAARYLRAAGGETNVRAAVYAYNHSQSYVGSVMLRAQLLGGTPPELLGAVTGLTEARFPVHAPSHFSDGFPTVAGAGIPATAIYSQAGAPVVAVQDGQVVQIGDSPTLGRFVRLRDAFGNTYTYGGLGDVAALYPVLVPHVNSSVSRRIANAGGREPAPTGPATAGAQPRSPLSEAATVSGLALGAAAGLESLPASRPAQSTTAGPPAHRPPARQAREFREGPTDVYLHPLTADVQVIAGTVLGHVGAGGEGGPHILFQIRPAGAGASEIDPKPILDGWVALENSSIFRAKGENPFLATSPSVGQVLLESKQQLEQEVLRDGGIRLGRCGRGAAQAGNLDRRVLAMLEYLSVSGLRPTVSGIRCAASTASVGAANAASGTQALEIVAVNGIPVAGHQGAGSIADQTVRRLLMLQGVNRPQRIVSLMSYPGGTAVAQPSATRAIGVAFRSPAGAARRSAPLTSGLAPGQWTRLIARLGQIPDPTVAHAPSSAAILDREGAGRGNG